MTGLVDPDTPNLGASGAIMGLAGAYLYLFPYAPIRLVWFLWFFLIPRFGIMEWQARWVILYFVGLDVFNGILMGGGDGVGHFAHLGGAVAGFLAVWLLRMPRDTEDVSEVQATLADMRDVTLLSLYQLEALMQQPTTDVRLILTYCRQCLVAPMGASEAKCLWALRQYSALLMEQANPSQLAGVLLPLSLPTARQIPPMYYLRARLPAGTRRGVRQCGASVLPPVRSLPALPGRGNGLPARRPHDGADLWRPRSGPVLLRQDARSVPPRRMFLEAEGPAASRRRLRAPGLEGSGRSAVRFNGSLGWS